MEWDKIRVTFRKGFEGFDRDSSGRGSRITLRNIGFASPIGGLQPCNSKAQFQTKILRRLSLKRNSPWKIFWVRPYLVGRDRELSVPWDVFGNSLFVRGAIYHKLSMFSGGKLEWRSCREYRERRPRLHGLVHTTKDNCETRQREGRI